MTLDCTQVENIWIGGSVTADSSTYGIRVNQNDKTFINALQVDGALVVNNDITTNGVVHITNTTGASNVNSGALEVDGGVGVAEKHLRRW